MLKYRTTEKHRQSYYTTSLFWFYLLSFTHATTAASNSIFLFGDAVFDSGNNNDINPSDAKANYSPYGVSYFPTPTGRFSDGRIIPDFLAIYANLSFIPPFLQLSKDGEFHDGVNFASAGSGALAQTFQGEVISLDMQLDNYRKFTETLTVRLGNEATAQLFSKSVYLFSTGATDYAYLLLTNSTFLTTYSKSDIVDMVIANITSVVREVYETGGRRFGFLNVPVLGCVPGHKMLTTDGDCLEEASSYADKHNEALLYSLQLLEKELPEFKYSVFDIDSCVQKRINNPSQYGYKETRAACCGSGRLRGEFSCGGKRGIEEYEVCDNRDEYVFWDAFHFTETANRQCADDMWSTTTTSPNNSMSYGPYTIKDLFQLP
ncbi:hypothetical protein vseg_004063 [Gypsophila vaccaria]